MSHNNLISLWYDRGKESFCNFCRRVILRIYLFLFRMYSDYFDVQIGKNVNLPVNLVGSLLQVYWIYSAKSQFLQWLNAPAGELSNFSSNSLSLTLYWRTYKIPVSKQSLSCSPLPKMCVRQQELEFSSLCPRRQQDVQSLFLFRQTFLEAQRDKTMWTTSLE